MSKVLGYFVFQNVGDGCLVSKYANWMLYSPMTECAKLKKKEPATNGYEGEYRSTWIEDPNDPAPSGQIGQAALVISRKENTDGIYTVEWSDGATFHGEGMIFDELLVGAYWNPELHGPTPALPKR